MGKQPNLSMYDSSEMIEATHHLQRLSWLRTEYLSQSPQLYINTLQTIEYFHTSLGFCSGYFGLTFATYVRVDPPMVQLAKKRLKV